MRSTSPVNSGMIQGAIVGQVFFPLSFLLKFGITSGPAGATYDGDVYGFLGAIR
jgi:hypothetical protein